MFLFKFDITQINGKSIDLSTAENVIQYGENSYRVKVEKNVQFSTFCPVVSNQVTGSFSAGPDFKNIISIYKNFNAHDVESQASGDDIWVRAFS